MLFIFLWLDVLKCLKTNIFLFRTYLILNLIETEKKEKRIETDANGREDMRKSHELNEEYIYTLYDSHRDELFGTAAQMCMHCKQAWFWEPARRENDQCSSRADASEAWTER